MHSPRIIALCATVVWLTPLLTAQAPVPTSPAVAQKSRDWKRLEAPDLLVVGNARAADLRRTAEEIERFRATIRMLFPRLPMTSPVPTVAVVFSDDNALRPYKPRYRGKPRDNVAAYFSALPDINYIVLAPSSSREFTYRVIFHEYTHFLVSRSSPRLPRWLNEGLAEFYSTFNGADRDSRTVLGGPIPGHTAVLREPGGVIPLKKFLDPNSLSEFLRDESTTQRFYAESWAMTHYLVLGDNGKHQPRLRDYMAALQAGEAMDGAFTRIFGEDLAPLQSGLRDHIHNVTIPVLFLKALDVKTTGAVEPMDETEAQQLQADLLLRIGASDEARKPLERALALDPQHIPSRLSHARLLMADDKADAALELLSAPELQDATDFATAFLRAEVLRAARRYDDSVPAYERALAAHRYSAPAYYGLTLSQLALGLPEAVVSFARCRAVLPDPLWFHSRVYDAQRIGRDTYTISDATSYVEQQGWHDTSSPYVMYVAALTAMRQQKPERANALLDEISSHVGPKSWQATIVEYLRGHLTVDAFLKRADPEALLTEAHAYIGIKAHIDGDRATALQHLQWVKDKGRRDYTEYGLALGELDRLEREK
jgi:tetratricopeptide (TPR) repeat protein